MRACGRIQDMSNSNISPKRHPLDYPAGKSDTIRQIVNIGIALAAIPALKQLNRTTIHIKVRIGDYLKVIMRNGYTHYVHVRLAHGIDGILKPIFVSNPLQEHSYSSILLGADRVYLLSRPEYTGGKLEIKKVGAKWRLFYYGTGKRTNTVFFDRWDEAMKASQLVTGQIYIRGEK